jgi:hypothetical protein
MYRYIFLFIYIYIGPDSKIRRAGSIENLYIYIVYMYTYISPDSKIRCAGSIENSEHRGGLSHIYVYILPYIFIYRYINT